MLFRSAKFQLEHLNELLNESELNNVRLTEQINVLKEEIRRFFCRIIFDCLNLIKDGSIKTFDSKICPPSRLELKM